MEPAKLSTWQRNALSSLFGTKEFTPEDVAKLDHAAVARLPKIGKKGIEAIRTWLQGCGYDLSNLPEDNKGFAERRLKNRLLHAARLLQKHGFHVEPPA